MASLVAGVLISCVALAQETEIELLRAEVEQLRTDYDARIVELERRLAVAEQNANDARYALQSDVVAQQAPAGRSAGAAAYNPSIGVIFQGQVWQHEKDPEGYAVQGLPFGGEAGPFSEGLSLGETELIFNANVDDKFSAWLTAALALEDGEAVAEIEEAFVETTALPAGLGVKFGRFYSGIGYLNAKHAHTWDFADQPLPYQAFLADQYADNGLQVRWLAPTPLFLELGRGGVRGQQLSGRRQRKFRIWQLLACSPMSAAISAPTAAGLPAFPTSTSKHLSGRQGMRTSHCCLAVIRR